MVLKYDSLEKVKEHVQYNNSPVVIYGAGMIGQIIMPYMITSSLIPLANDSAVLSSKTYLIILA